MIRNRVTRWMLPLMLLAAAAGCHGSGAASTSMATPQKAVLITTGNGTSYVVLPTTDNSGVQRLAADAPGPVCKQCEEDSLAYFRNGVISPKCPVCGASRIPVHSVN